MDQVHVVRHKVLVEGRSQRAVARELGLARVTVRKYLEQAAADPEGRRRRELGRCGTWSARAWPPCWPSRPTGPAENSS